MTEETSVPPERVNEAEGGAAVRSTDGFCRVCGKKHPAKEIRNLNIYVFGSEGVNICHSCEMGVVEFLRAMSGVGSRARLQGYRSALEVREAKRQNTRTEPLPPGAGAADTQNT